MKNKYIPIPFPHNDTRTAINTNSLKFSNSQISAYDQYKNKVIQI